MGVSLDGNFDLRCYELEVYCWLYFDPIWARKAMALSAAFNRRSSSCHITDMQTLVTEKYSANGVHTYLKNPFTFPTQENNRHRIVDRHHFPPEH